MLETKLSPQAVVRRGIELYDERIRPHVEPEHRGQFLSLDINTGDYEIDDNDLAAELRLRARLPNAIIYALRIGYRAAYKYHSPTLKFR